MRREFTSALIAFVALLATTFAAAQQPTPPSDPTSPTQANEPIYKIGGHISAPAVIHSVEAKYTDEARRADYQGACLISLTVDAKGHPVNVHVVRALGMGLDEKAMEAIRQYKFRPAMKDGKTPVPVMITIEVNFRL